MLTFYHAPKSRSSTILVLLKELGVMDQIDLRKVEIGRADGSGGADTANAHPEGKVPYLVNGDDHIRERGAIMLYLTDMFPQQKLGPLPGDPKRGEYLSWLSWYQGVFEPVAILHYAKISHPALNATFRDYDTAVRNIEAALEKGPWLLGDNISAADLLVASPFAFFGPDVMPRTPRIDDWVNRIQSRPSMAWAREFDA